MTPYVTGLAVEAWGEDRREQYEMLLSAAWHGAVLERVKQVPPLEKILGRKTVEDDPKKGAEAIKAALMAYSAGYEAKKSAVNAGKSALN